VTLLTRSLALQMAPGITGGFFLLRLAWLALSEAFARRDTSSASVSTTRGDARYGSGVWLGQSRRTRVLVGSGKQCGRLGSDRLAVWVFLCWFLSRGCALVLGISVVIRWGRRWIQTRMFRLINALCGLALGYFGIRVLWTTMQEWLEHQVGSTRL
jgi:threonine/homoserine/homoserine lactone efflux protein